MKRWAKGFGILGLLLVVIAVLPPAMQLTILPGIDPVFAVLALYSVGPLGVLSLLFAAFFFVAWLIRR